MVEQTTQSPPPYASETLLRLAPPATPEDRLMLAVLLDAVALLREHATGVRPHLQRLVADTARWFVSDDDGWPLSFANICLGLGLDAPTLRGGLERELTDLGARALLRPGCAEVIPLRGSPVGTRALRERAARSCG
jgi:hypothetical protein